MTALTYSAERTTIRIGDREFPIQDACFTSPPARVHPAVERPSRWAWEPVSIGMAFAALHERITRPDPLTFIGAAANTPPPA